MLTEEEKHAVSLFINKANKVPAVFDYGVYIVPSLGFAIYGLIKGDLIAILVAYGALLLVAVLYLSHSRNYTNLLRSALKKYSEIYKKHENLT